METTKVVAAPVQQPSDFVTRLLIEALPSNFNIDLRAGSVDMQILALAARRF